MGLAFSSQIGYNQTIEYRIYRVGEIELKKSDFKVIVGGLSMPDKIISRRFLSSFVTNTRFMGVVGLYINWEIETRDGFLSMHQYFYYDAEEFGFETYKAIYGNNVAELYIVEQTLHLVQKFH